MQLCRLNRRWRYEDESAQIKQDVAVRGGVAPKLQFSLPGNPSSGKLGNNYLRELAENYVIKNGGEFGIPFYRETPRQKLDHQLGYRTADAFEQAQHAPQDNQVMAAYSALGKETTAQLNHLLENGFKVEPWLQPGQPYKNSHEMARDVAGKHIWYFPTVNPNEAASFGAAGSELDPAHNLMLQKTGHNINGHELTVNDAFRAVHDVYGHAKDGFEFGPEGEYNAYIQHRKMFSPLAQQALATETHGQNSWVNFGHHLRGMNGLVAQKGEEGYIHPLARPFASQKMAIMPDHAVPRHPYLPEPEIKLPTLNKVKLAKVKDKIYFNRAVAKGIIRPKIGNYNPNLFSGDIHAIMLHNHSLTRPASEVWDDKRDVLAREFAKLVGRAPSNYRAPLQNGLSYNLNSLIAASPYEKPDKLAYEVAAEMLHNKNYKHFTEFSDQAIRRMMGLPLYEPSGLYTHAHGLGVFGDYAGSSPEPSLTTVFHRPVSALQLQKIAAEIGARANQISALNFNVHPEGDQQLFHARVKTHEPRAPLGPQLLGDIGKNIFEKFLAHGLSGGTVLPDRTGHSDVLFYNYEPKDWEQSRQKFVSMINGLPTENDAGPRYWPGTGMLIGDELWDNSDQKRRDNAHKIYAQTADRTTPSLPEPKSVKPTQLQRLINKLKLRRQQQPIKLMGPIERELQAILHGWMENPRDKAYQQQIVPDFLQEVGHPQEKLNDWYWNKALPEVAGVQYAPKIDQPTSYDNLLKGYEESNNGIDLLPKSNPKIYGQTAPLVGGALIRSLNLPRLKGNFLEAIRKVYGENSLESNIFHKHLLGRELAALGLLDHKEIPSDVTNDPYANSLLRNLHNMTQSSHSNATNDNSSNYLSNIIHGQFNYPPNPNLRDANSIPITEGRISNSVRNRVTATVGNAVGKLGTSAKENFGVKPTEKPEQLSMLQLGQHAPAGTGAVVRGVFYAPGKMIPTLETSPNHPEKVDPIQKPDMPKPISPPTQAPFQNANQIQPVKQPNSTPFLDRARGIIKKRTARLS